MKKLLCLILTAVLVLGFCACGGGEDAGETTAPADGLQVGYSKVNITPDYPVGLGGYSDQKRRIHEGMSEPIFATCIAVTSEDTTILLYTVDFGGLNLDRQEMFRPMIATATGVPEEHIFMGSTHTHSAPSTTGYPNAEKYVAQLRQWLIEAAETALADQSYATLSQAKAVHEGMNFVRHYTMADGTLVANSDVEDRTQIVGHPMESDNQMTILKFDRADEAKKDILMINWQTHPAYSSDIGYKLISPDFIGPLRNKLEADTGMHVAYFTGAVGNQVGDSKWAQEDHGLKWNKYGEKLAELALPMLDTLTPVEGTEIKTIRYNIDAPVDHSWDHMVKEAKEVYALFEDVDRPTADALGETYGFTSCYQAKAIINRSTMGPTIPMEINVFCIGGVGFTTGTYEMFSCNGMYVKENSPFDTTFLISGTSSYMPSDITYTYRGYEQDTTTYARGTGEMFAEKYVELLGQLKTN